MAWPSPHSESSRAESSGPDPAQPSEHWPAAWWRAAYAEGWYPMADPDSGRLGLYRSRRRAILPLDDRFHVPRTLRRALRGAQGEGSAAAGPRWQLRLNQAFESVLADCADRPHSWISPELRRIYRSLHQAGLVHSAEIHDEGGLAAGMLALGIGSCWIGESMAHRRPQAGNALMVQLVTALRAGGFALFDVQLSNPHLQRFGCVEIDDASYRQLLAAALRRPSYLRHQDGCLTCEAWVAQ
jgi:leucyl/phenylalanyl-tRNA--protein transferase